MPFMGIVENSENQILNKLNIKGEKVKGERA